MGRKREGILTIALKVIELYFLKKPLNKAIVANSVANNKKLKRQVLDLSFLVFKGDTEMFLKSLLTILLVVVIIYLLVFSKVIIALPFKDITIRGRVLETKVDKLIRGLLLFLLSFFLASIFFIDYLPLEQTVKIFSLVVCAVCLIVIIVLSICYLYHINYYVTNK